MISSDIHSLREQAEAAYNVWLATECVEAMKGFEDRLEIADIFAHARRINEDRQEYGAVRPETVRHARIEAATAIAESLGSCDITIELAFDGNDILDQRGRQERLSRGRAVLAATALENTDPGFAFYARRTKAELLNHTRIIDMMRDAPVGTVLRIISPTETTRPDLAERLGMAPERDMAMLYDIWKVSDTTALQHILSHDRLTPDVIATLRRQEGRYIPDGINDDDHLLFVDSAQAQTKEEFMALGAARSAALDTLLMGMDPYVMQSGKRPKQGIIGDENRRHHTKLEDLEQSEYGQLALRQRYRFDEALSRVIEPGQLPQLIKVSAQQTLHKMRRDGRPLLNPNQQALVRNLLTAKKVTMHNSSHVAALEIIKKTYNTGIEETLRNYFATDDPTVLNWMRYDDNQELTFVGSVDMLNAATTAVEEGRESVECGDGVKLLSTPNQPVDSQEALHCLELALFGFTKRHGVNCPGCTEITGRKVTALETEDSITCLNNRCNMQVIKAAKYRASYINRPSALAQSSQKQPSFLEAVFGVAG